ncbi:MAG: hypothetical protein HC769_28150 [Cyanobacteria bacterium CRU_2_1]|nr:hypothetical protein [Cyanobacteria bacterium CRU_2_1]
MNWLSGDQALPRGYLTPPPLHPSLLHSRPLPLDSPPEQDHFPSLRQSKSRTVKASKLSVAATS